MNSMNEHLIYLGKAIQIIEEIEGKFDDFGQEETRNARSLLREVGRNVNRQENYDQFLGAAMGEAAGVAIEQGWYDLANRAIRIGTNDVKLPSIPAETVGDEADIPVDEDTQTATDAVD